jgi:hypothetical protein
MRKTLSAFVLVGLMGVGLCVALMLVQAVRSASAPLSPQITFTVEPTRCPEATPEQFFVEPITSPTTSLSQVITISIGNREWARVETESGVFTSTTTNVNVALLPNITHHLTATGKVARIGSPPGCVYGDYTLSSTRDKNNKPLEIQQLGRRSDLPIVIQQAPQPYQQNVIFDPPNPDYGLLNPGQTQTVQWNIRGAISATLEIIGKPAPSLYPNCPAGQTSNVSAQDNQPIQLPEGQVSFSFGKKGYYEVWFYVTKANGSQTTIPFPISVACFM